MSVKRVEIVNKLLIDFPAGTATQSELMEWAERNGYSKYAPSFVWKKEYRVDRGLFKIPNETELKTETLNVPLDVVVDERTETVSVPDTATNLMMTTDIDNMVPEKFEGFVSWGYFKEIKSIIRSKMFYPIFVTGLSGNGKTLNVQEACAELGRECVRVNVTIETDEDDLIGGFRLVDGETKFNLGPVAIAMERGAVLLLDEVDLASNKIMCLQPVLEGNPLLIKKEGRIVRPKAGFSVMATANTKGKGSEDGRFIGTNILNEAFLERFPITVEQEYPSVSVEKKIINKLMFSLGCLDEEFSGKLVDWADLIRKTFYDGGVDEIIATRRLVHIVQAFSIFKDRMKAIAMCVARFDDQTKDTFMDLYSKLDEKVSMPSDETEEGEDSESTETEEEDENFKPF